MSANEVKFKCFSIAELYQALPENKYVIVDIRDPESFQAGRIPGAIHLSNETLPDFLRDADYDAPVVVCCYHGVSSQQAAQFLVSQDFTEVYSLDGGFVQWQSVYADSIEK